MARKNKGITEVEGKTYWVNVKVDCPSCFERAEQTINGQQTPCYCVRLFEIEEKDEPKDSPTAV